MGHAYYHVLADMLSRKGIAVYRVDDRGKGSTGDPWVGYDTLAKDLVSAVSTLKHQAKIDENKIGVIGHSQGGAIGPMAALHSSEILFLVILGGLGVPGDKLMTKQKSDALKAAGIQGAYYEKRMAAYRLLMKTIVDNGDEHAVERALTALFDVAFPPLLERRCLKVNLKHYSPKPSDR